MTNNLDPDLDDWTVDELLEMSDEDFLEAACEDLNFTKDWNGPFQSREVIHRTIATLSDRLSFTDGLLEKGAGESTKSFRNHISSVLKNTKLRADLFENSARKHERFWKEVANILCDELEESDRAFMLDEINLSDFFGATPGMKMTLREWVAKRREKNPDRIPVWTEAA